MGTILVTGAAGFIGSHSCERLLAEGHRVLGIDNFRTGRAENLATLRAHERFEFSEGDITDATFFDRTVAASKPDAIIHLAALVSVPQSLSEPETNFRLNVLGTQRIIDASAKNGVRRVVFASSAAVYGENPELPLSERSETRPISPYGGAKLASEALLLGHAALGFIVRCQRYFNVYGPRQDPRSPYSGVISIFCDKLRAGQAPTVFGDGEQTRDFISVHDVARANAIAATAPDLANGVVNICTGRPTSLNHLAAILRRHVANAPAMKHADSRAGDIRHSLGSPERARLELGFSPRVPLEDGLAELIRS